jgi:restriction endonuclease S subunit
MITFVSKIDERLGVVFYNPEIKKFLNNLQSSGLEYTTLENIIEKDSLTGGSTPKGAPYLNEGVNFIRVKDIDEDGNIDFENCKKISLQNHQKNRKSKIDFLDLLLVVTGATVGKVAIFESQDIEININQNIAKISVDKSKINPFFLFYYLKSKAGQMQLLRNAQRMAQEYLNYPAIKSIDIAYPNLLSKQKKILKKSENFRKRVYEIKREYDRNVNKLSLIFENNIDFATNIKEKKIFIAKSFSDRMDCFSLNPTYGLIMKNLEQLRADGIISLAKSPDLNFVEHTISNDEFEMIKVKKFKYLEIGDTTEHPNQISSNNEDLLVNLPTRARKFIQENDVIIPRPIGSTDKITIIGKELDGQLCSTGFLILRAENYNEACLLTAILKSSIVQKQLYFLQSGSVQPEISIKNFKKIIFPIPSSKRIKDQIIEEFKFILDKSSDLLKEYYLKKPKIEDYFLSELLSISE